ncbi:hypothetical protein MNB_SUP05-5-520 [hydrothermal vent metagenome]|uniref:Cytochrome c n=1 Tax=hydrothermal vent metagenome TaxID=652676 RepID=A0A1W1CS75_9ZZZZ
MKNLKILWAIIIILSILSGFLVYKFVAGSVVKSDDNRIAISLDKKYRNYILDEMRQFLISVQTIGLAINENKIDKVVSLATKAGMAAEKNTPAGVFRALPLSMKTLGFGTRKKFDDVAKSAKNGATQTELRKKLNNLLGNCIACHSTYKLVESNKK